MLRPDQSEGAERCGRNSIQGRGTAKQEALGWTWPGVRQEQRGVEGGGETWGGGSGEGHELSLVCRSQVYRLYFQPGKCIQFLSI